MYPGERFNSITHVVGSAFALIGTVALIIVTASQGPARLIPLAVYGFMLLAMYLSSTLYHSLRPGKAKNVFHIFDHCAIYMLIAGTYTPLTLLVLRGSWGWTLFAIVWTLAVAGMLKDAVLPGRFRAVSVVLYILMGWLVVIAFNPLRHAFPAPGIVWLAAGGVFYTVGVVFFALSKHVPYTHGVWHLFVIGGSACHYVAVMRYVALPGH